MHNLRTAVKIIDAGINSLATLNVSSYNRRACFSKATQKTRNKSYWYGRSNTSLVFESEYAALRRCADNNGDNLAIAVQHQDIRKTYAEYLYDVDTLSSGLLSLGHCEPGSLVAIFAPNVYEWTVAQFACAKIGVALANVNPACQSSEIEHVLNLSQSSVVIVGDPAYTPVDLYSFIEKLAPELESEAKTNDLRLKRLPHLRSIVTMGKEKRMGAVQYAELLANGSGSKLRSRCEAIHNKVDADSIANVQFTSGTTGKPKAVLLTHHNLVNNARIFGARIGLNEVGTSVLLNVPLFHCFGCSAGLLGAVQHGATIVLPAPRFNATASISAIEKYKCTIAYGTPTMFIDILSTLPSNTTFPSMEKFIIGGAPVPDELIFRVKRSLGIAVWPAYGATEMSPVATAATPTADGRLLQLALDHTELKVVDSKGNIVDFGQRGELCCRGYNITQGYLHQPDKTAEVIKDGWYHTGDEAIMSLEGDVKITGRLKDMIIRGGENIYPAEIEDLLLTFNEIEEAHVFGVPEPRMGEDVAVWIKLRDGKTITAEQLKTKCQGKLSHFKIPRYIEFVTGFPKTSSGKIQKYVMRQEMSKILSQT